MYTAKFEVARWCLESTLCADDGGLCLVHTGDSHVDHFIDDGLCGLALVADCSGLAHQERPGLVLGLLIDIIAPLLHVVFNGYDALGGQLLDVGLTVGLPVVDIRIVPDSQRAAGEDDGADVVVKAGGADGFLVGLGGAGFITQDEASAYPDRGRAEHQRRCQRLAVEETARSNDLYGSTGHGRLVAAAQLCDGRDEDGSRNIASVASALATLSADEVDAEIETFLDVFRVPNHVHVQHARLVQLFDNVLRRHADGTYKEFRAGLDDDVD